MCISRLRKRHCDENDQIRRLPGLFVPDHRPCCSRKCHARFQNVIRLTVRKPHVETHVGRCDGFPRQHVLEKLFLIRDLSGCVQFLHQNAYYVLFFRRVNVKYDAVLIN